MLTFVVIAPCRKEMVPSIIVMVQSLEYFFPFEPIVGLRDRILSTRNTHILIFYWAKIPICFQFRVRGLL